MKYCKTCFYPETKPDLVFDEEQICSACISFKERSNINWGVRENEFLKIVKKIKTQRKSNYDCVIPVSGGKDSTWQVLKVLEYGLNPLCVNARTCDFSEIGKINLENIKKLGIDMIEVSPNLKIRSKLNKIGLIEVGDISWPEHIGIFTIPVKIALNFKIQYIFWGENSQNEYGGPISKMNNAVLDRSWLEEFGGLLGLRLHDLTESYGIKVNDLLVYTYPDKKEVEKENLQGLFLGHFFPWNGNENAEIAKKNGFKYYEKEVEGASNRYENLDNFQAGIHDYFKYIKYGFGRTTDIMCNLYRRKLISKEKAIYKIKQNDGKFPVTYLGKNIKNILEEIDVSFVEFIETCDKFTNKRIFKCDNNGKPIRDKDFNLKFNVDPFN